MAMESFGYAGTVDELDWAQLVGGFGATYAVVGVGSWRPGTTTAVARGITVQPGEGSGRGVYDKLTGEPVVLAADVVVGGGVRYDTLVARRHWASKTTSFVLRKGGASLELAGTIVHNPGVEDDHPIAVYAISGNNAVLAADLRIWRGGGGGLVAVDELALQIVQSPGTRMYVNGRDYVCVPTSTGATRWRSAGVRLIPGSALSPVATPPADADFIMQAGTTVVRTDQSGFGRVTWPTPFPNGLLSLNLINGDENAGNDITMNPGGAIWSPGDRNSVVYRLWGPSGPTTRVVLPNFTHRVDWQAWGW